MITGIAERHRIVKHKKQMDKIRQAGDAMAHEILGQIEHGHTSPFETTTTNSIRGMSDEMFLLNSTKRAVERLAVSCPDQEIPLYDEPSTIVINNETRTKELVVVFARPSEI